MFQLTVCILPIGMCFLRLATLHEHSKYNHRSDDHDPHDDANHLTQTTPKLTACTGQASLPTNITQAQAFCIATACLQVKVSLDHKPDTLASLPPLSPLSSSSSSSFMSSKLSPYWIHPSHKTSGPNWLMFKHPVDHRVSKLLPVSQKSKIVITTPATNASEERDEVLDIKDFHLWRRSLSYKQDIDMVPTNTSTTTTMIVLAQQAADNQQANNTQQQRPGDDTTTTTTENSIGAEAPTATSGDQATSTDSSTGNDSDSSPTAYPNFNQMHAQIEIEAAALKPSPKWFFITKPQRQSIGKLFYGKNTILHALQRHDHLGGLKSLWHRTSAYMNLAPHRLYT